MTYRVFVRAWWRENKDWPDGLEPNASGRKRTIRRGVATEAEAKAICRAYNTPENLKKMHGKNRLSYKAEYE